MVAGNPWTQTVRWHYMFRLSGGIYIYSHRALEVIMKHQHCSIYSTVGWAHCIEPGRVFKIHCIGFSKIIFGFLVWISPYNLNDNSKQLCRKYDFLPVSLLNKVYLYIPASSWTNLISINPGFSFRVSDIVIYQDAAGAKTKIRKY